MPAKSLSRQVVNFLHLFIALLLTLSALLSPSSLAMAAPPESPLSAPFTSCAEVIEIPQAECEALVALYNATGGANWVNNTDWLQTDTPCNWYGVTCSGGYVTKIILYGNQLIGNIPYELGNLTNLEYLILFANQLSGSIPSELGDLINLENLKLDGNQLTGVIPSALGSLTNLRELDLSANQLTGSIPPGFGNLTNLNLLFLDNNLLTGSIPPELGNLTSLWELHLSHNQLTGSIPSALGNLANLYYLYLDSNQLTGSIPSALGDLTNLYYLALNSNQLTGGIPTELGNMSSLSFLYLAENQMSGEIPSWVTNLYDLSLSCGLTSTDPDVIAFIDGILGPGWNTGCPVAPVNDNFADALLIDSIPYFDTQDTTLATTETDDPNFPCGSGDQGVGSVWYRYTATTDGFLALDTFGSNYDTMLAVWTGNFGALTNVACGDDSINTYQSSLSVPVTSGQTYYIEVAGYDSGTLELNVDFVAYQLFTSCSSITGITQAECEGLVALYNSTDGANWSDNTGWLHADAPCFWYGVYCENGRFESLVLPSNQLTGNIPPELGNLVNLRVVHFGSNQLTGTIPIELVNLTNLEHLVLSDNQLTGSIPPALGTLTNLWGLRLEDNQLTGSIPPELGNLTNLSGLSLSHNQLTGSIPQSLGSLTNLWSLYLSGNQLIGNIPYELGNLTNLRYFYLYDNQLTGNLPNSFGNLTRLRGLLLDYNQLSGEFPTSITNLVNLTDFTFDCTLTSSDPAVIAFLKDKAPDSWWACYGNISGHVYAANGVNPIENMAVSLVTGENIEHARACTGADGAFVFEDVPNSSSYRVVAVPAWRCAGQTEGYTREYWQDTYDFNQATVITLSESQPNYDGIVFNLEQGQTATEVVGTEGGTVATPDETVKMDIPADAVSEEITFTITDGGTGYQVATDEGSLQAVSSVVIGPPGTTFATPVTLTFTWPDTDNDGIVDGTTIPEGLLYMSKDGVVLAGPCNTDPACDLDANTISIQVSSLSFFVIGPEAFTVTFDSQGGSDVPDQMVNHSDYATKPTDPTRTGYTFEGWYDASTDGSLWDFANTPITADTTLYAHWTVNQYTITFDSAGGSPVDAITQDYGSAITSPADPTRTGYTFASWSPSLPATMPAESLTLTAQWTIDQYTITFDSAGGSSVDAITQDYGSAIIPPADPTRTGYTFVGWNPSVPVTMPAEDLTLTAQWTVNQYTITFDSAGGSSVDAITQDYGSAITAPADPTRIGYTFAGWSSALPATMPAENLTLTAQWTINQYTVTFDANGGGGSMALQSGEYNTIVALNANTFTRIGYNFNGWNTQADGSGTAYADGANYIFVADLTLYAQWQQNSSVAFGKIAPVNGATGQSLFPTLSWQASAGAASYEYCIDTTNDNACAPWVSTGSNTSVRLSGLSANATYYWQVRATNADGTAYANDSLESFWSFTTGEATATFPDVPVSYWAWAYVERLYNAGLTGGYPDGTYRPANTVTRAEMAIFLMKGMNGPDYSPPVVSPTFTDTDSHWAANWIEALKAAGLTGGYPDGTYRPNSPVTRAEMAIFLLKAMNGAGYTPPSASPTFSDTAEHWAANWIEALKAAGITSGYPDGTYRPGNYVTRAEMAVFLVKAFGLP